jgi:hypothetical protein
MIALLLAAQLSAATPQAQTPDVVPPTRGDFVQLLQRRKATSCIGNIGQMEISFAQPAALYRKGDRPARGLRKWADYPEPMLCAVEAGR